jgi:hypothetical protein
MTGCFKTPSDTMRVPEYSEADSIFNTYKKMLRENKPPSKLLEYLKLNKNISKLHKSTADVAIIRIIELQKKQLVEYQTKCKTYLKDIKAMKEKERHDITEEARIFINDVESNGFMFSPDYQDVEIDYQKIKKIAGNYLSDELKVYIEIESEEASGKYSLDESLDNFLIKHQDNVQGYLLNLAEMLNKTFEYTTNYTDSPYSVQINELRSKYLRIFFFGSPNNPAFLDYQRYSKNRNTNVNININNNKINQKWNEAYKLVKNKYPNDTKFGLYVANHYNELSKNNFELTEVLYEDIISKIG